jgi:hypothetical protein
MRVTLQAKLSLRSNFSFSHLQAAVRAASDAYEIEQNNPNAELNSRFDEMMRLVPVSIIMSAAALEANANETIQNILDGSSRLTVTKGSRALLKELLDSRTGGIADKYNKLALLCDKELDKGHVSWHDANLLEKFRNAFMHFKPAWDDDTSVHDSKFVNAMKNKVPIFKPYATNFQFPYGFMTYGCACWSVRSVVEFSKHFSDSLGVTDTFGGMNFNLPQT